MAESADKLRSYGALLANRYVMISPTITSTRQGVMARLFRLGLPFIVAGYTGHLVANPTKKACPDFLAVARPQPQIHLSDRKFLEHALSGRPVIDLPTIRRRIRAILRDGNLPDPWNPFSEPELGVVRVEPNFERASPQRIEAFPTHAQFSPEGISRSKRLKFIVAGDQVYREPLWAQSTTWDVYNFKGDVIVSKMNLSDFALSFITDSTAHLIRVMGSGEADLWRDAKHAKLKSIGRAGSNVLHFNVGAQLWQTKPHTARFDADVPLSVLRAWSAKKWLKVGWHLGSVRHGALAGGELAITMDAVDELAPYLHQVEPYVAKFEDGTSVRLKKGPHKGEHAIILSLLETEPFVRYLLIGGPTESPVEFEANEIDLKPLINSK